MRDALRLVLQGNKLSENQAQHVMVQVLDGQGSPEQVSALLGALRLRGETASELLGFVRELRKRETPFVTSKKDCIDNCGTGGDGAGTFNISTCSALILAAGGVGVIKHGNRSVSSRSGSCDVLEALGIATTLGPQDAARCLEMHGFVFLMAPHYHPAFGKVAQIRKSIGVPTAFNLLGPLLNPARVHQHVIGVFDPRLVLPMAQVLMQTGSKRALVVCAREASGQVLDELSISGETQLAHLENGRIREFTVTPGEVGLESSDLSALSGGTALENALLIQTLLEGKKGGARDVVVLNAGAGFWISGKSPDLISGVKTAAATLDSGAGHELLQSLRSFK